VRSSASRALAAPASRSVRSWVPASVAASKSFWPSALPRVPTSALALVLVLVLVPVSVSVWDEASACASVSRWAFASASVLVSVLVSVLESPLVWASASA
jgi:hypothetical protein